MKHLLLPDEEELAEHYPTRAERTADMIVHAVAIGAAAVGGLFLVVMALARGGVSLASSTLIYAICLMAMLVASNIYNLKRPGPHRRVLRRLDEAAIFLLIAGSYTPFTTQRFESPWDVPMTAIVWAVAIAGVIGKLFFPKVPEWLWTGVYVAFGWLAVLMLKPLLMDVSAVALVLLAIGGLLYTAGVPLFLWRNLPFRRAIWHGFVVAGAAVHYVAVLTGVVLVGAAT
jgi:hemolysin III